MPQSMTTFCSRYLPPGISVFAVVIAAAALGGPYADSPHGSQTDGVMRTPDFARGSCAQCHSSHDPVSAHPFGLFAPPANDLCFGASLGGCHADKPTGATAGYPAQESDRMPSGSSDPGYFEFSSGSARLPGLANQVRWPGRTVWENSLWSAHYSDPDMPIKDLYGNGSCDNCHDVHGGRSSHDMLDTTYQGIVGSQIGSLPEQYMLCLSCHNVNGPAGMSDTSRNIAYYYDRSINPEHASGHGVDGGGYVPSGARMPCYNCHNAHGSEGYNGLGPNSDLLSDQRPGWYGLTDIRNDASQVRRFCFGCHPSSDGIGGGTVEGLAPEPLPYDVPAHAGNAADHCYDCHGRDYSSPTSHNVHNPAPGD